MKKTKKAPIREGFANYEIRRLETIQRFVMGVLDPDVAVAARRAGYDDEEHRAGTADLRIAQGAAISFSQCVAAGPALEQEPPPNLFAETALFCSKWFAPTRNAFRRFAPPEGRKAAEQAFFRGIVPGPAPIDAWSSVVGFLEQIDRMPESQLAWERQIYAAVVKKGLEPDLAHIRAVLHNAKKLPALDHAAMESLALLQAERRAAFERVTAWYNDWAETLRPKLSYHQLVRMGLQRNKGGRRTGAKRAPK